MYVDECLAFGAGASNSLSCSIFAELPYIGRQASPAKLAVTIDESIRAFQGIFADDAFCSVICPN